MEHQQERRGIAPWVWVLIVLAAIILIFVIWWAVAAQGPERAVVAPGGKQPTIPPTQQPPPQQSVRQPQVVERQVPVNIYIETEKPQLKVIVVPKGQQPPEAKERLRLIDLPTRFRYQGEIWEPSDEALMGERVNLKDTGASIDGNIVYASQDAETPYNELYLETEPGSGIFIKYKPTT